MYFGVSYSIMQFRYKRANISIIFDNVSFYVTFG